jgi:hypothetical protein
MSEVASGNAMEWPSLAESTDIDPDKNNSNNNNNNNNKEDLPVIVEGWEIIASQKDDQKQENEEEDFLDEKKEPEEYSSRNNNNNNNNNNDSHHSKILHRCVSTPEFARTTSSTIEDNIDIRTLGSDDSSLVYVSTSTQNKWASSTSSNSTTMKKVPSFKDIILLNAQKEQEEQSKRILLQETLEQQRIANLATRRSTKPKFIVSPIKRCIQSTPDLRSLVSIQEHQEDDMGGGGGGGAASTTILEEPLHEEVMGNTDAMEFYHQKSKGSISRANGLKIRPDEAKRKDMILFKKNAQKARQKQAA